MDKNDIKHIYTQLQDQITAISQRLKGQEADNEDSKRTYLDTQEAFEKLKQYTSKELDELEKKRSMG